MLAMRVRYTSSTHMYLAGDIVFVIVRVHVSLNNRSKPVGQLARSKVMPKELRELSIIGSHDHVLQENLQSSWVLRCNWRQQK